MTLGERIKLLRGDMAREKFALLTSIVKNTLVNYETDASSPQAEYLNRLLSLFPDINPAWLLTGEGPMKRGEEARSGLTGDPQPAYCAPLQRNSDPEIVEIVDILKHDLPEAKRFVLKVLRGRKETKEGLEGLGLKMKEEN